MEESLSGVTEFESFNNSISIIVSNELESIPSSAAFLQELFFLRM